MRKIYLYISLLIVFFSGCNHTVSVNIPKNICTILEKYDIYSANISYLGQYSTCFLEKIDITVTDDEVNEYIDTLIESFSEIVPVNDRDIVEDGDVVYVTYTIFRDNEIVNYVESDNLVVGAGYYDPQFEKALVGRKVGEPFKVTLMDSNGEYFMFNIIIESINCFKTYDLSEKTIQEKMGFATIDECYAFCYNDIFTSKEKQEKINKEKDLFLSIFELCDYSLNEEEIAKYSMYLIETQEQLASFYNLELELYINEVLQKNVDDFYQEYYELGEYKIKRYLTVGAIFQDLHFTVTQEEYKMMCETMKFDYNEAIQDQYIDAMVKYRVMEEEVLNFFYTSLQLLNFIKC